MEPDPPHEHPLDVTEFHPPSPELYDQQGRYIPTQIEYQNKKRKRFRLAIILFVVTCFSVFIAGMIPGGFAFVTLLDPASWSAITAQNQWATLLTNGCIYGGSLMLILFTHEMGHYLQAKRYGVPASFPFFIPFPIILCCSRNSSRIVFPSSIRFNTSSKVKVVSLGVETALYP